MVGIALNRCEHDFGDRDRRTLDVLRPHLAQAFLQMRERHALRERQRALDIALAETTEGVVLLHIQHTISYASERAQALLLSVADGRTDAEIAAELDLSTRTVQGHLRNIFEKLDIHTRTAAVKRAFG